MWNYVIRRILLFIPTLIAISLLTFFISVNAPGDPVEMMLHRGKGGEESAQQKEAAEKDYAALRHTLRLDLPLFYFSLTDVTVSDTLYRIINPSHREWLKRLSNKYGNWENVAAFYLAVHGAERWVYSIRKDSTNSAAIPLLKELLNGLYAQRDEEKISLTISGILASGIPGGERGGQPVEAAFRKMVAEKDPYQKYIPAVHWHGTGSQYHLWLADFIRGDFGISYFDKKPVNSSIYEALGKTLGISVLSILLAYGIAIPLGVHSAVNKGTKKEKMITTSLFILYSLPNFWIATLFVIFLCGGDYLSWFPGPGSPPIPDDAPMWYKLLEGSYRLILPLFCWTYGSLAFVSRQMRGGILASITQDYIQTARAKGLEEKRVIWKHALKNSLLPVITLFESIFPFAISGAFVIENIFNIPGMGWLSLQALYQRDYPVIFTVMMFTAILTMLGHLVSDVLYALVDPRISYTKKA